MYFVAKIFAIFGNLAIAIISTILIVYGISLLVDIGFKIIPCLFIGTGLLVIRTLSITLDKKDS